MDENLYDDFGNYIGPDIDDEEEDDIGLESYNEDHENERLFMGDESSQTKANGHMDMDGEYTGAPLKQAIILHEDKKYYPDAESIYGSRVKVTVQEEDIQHISEPIVQPESFKRFDHTEHRSAGLSTPWRPTEFNKSFMEGLMNLPSLVRHVAVIGHLHHGKTILLDSLIQQTHTDRVKIKDTRNERFTDSRYDEQERGMSIKATPVSLVLPNLKEKSYLINFLDTPGHPNFVDEVTAALRICDGALIVLDVVEGLTSHTQQLIRHSINEGLDLCLVMNKMDRLILELKLPPLDAFYKIRYVLDEVNAFVSGLPSYHHSHTNGDAIDLNEASSDDKGHPPSKFKPTFSPELGNVVFASGEHGWSFSLLQFAKIYSQIYKVSIAHDQFARRLWGPIFYHQDTRKFSTKQCVDSSSLPRYTFVQFVLEPIYKLYAQVIGEEVADMALNIKFLHISLSKEELAMDVLPLLKTVMKRFFGNSTGICDMIVKNVASPLEAVIRKIKHTYTGPMDSICTEAMINCDPNGPLMVQVVKQYPNKNNTMFYALGRIFSGKVKVGDRVKVLGETFGENEEDFKYNVVRSVLTYNTRYYIEHENIPAGNWVLLEGVDDIITKTATITSLNLPNSLNKLDNVYTFLPLRFCTLPVVKIAVEPLNPSELPKLVEGLRKVNKTYPILVTRVEESGERIILGTGELYLDSVLHDLRKVFTDIEIKVAEPVVTFSETVIETSSIKCYAETPNKMNKLSMIAEPMEKGLADDIESGNLKFEEKSPASMRQFLKTKYNWDAMATRNIWAFGPETYSPNILINDTLPTEVSQSNLNCVRDYIVRGFNWATREGPLCEEPIRNIRFKLIHANIASEAIQRNGTQIIPTSRRVAYSAFLTATPRLMEPVFSVDVVTPHECLSAIDRVLARRRGHVTSEKPKPGTPLYVVKAYLPCIDSFGFETDLRTHTQGQSFCLTTFDHWALVPGNPLDSSIVLKPLEPAPMQHLARDFMLKTRRRKGLGEDITISKFFDEDLLTQVQVANIDLF